ncbi:MAG TPA: hypothetical protein DCE14_08890 [Kosmotogaceae bacterium]|nr:hypothetical protein [Kosmotogaceae bacterium]
MAHIDAKSIDTSGFAFVIRNPDPDESTEILELMRQLDSETEYMLREAGELKMTPEQERHFIKKMLDDDKSLFIVAEAEEKVIASLAFHGNHLKRYEHQGEFAMGVLQAYWGRGVGAALVRTMLNWASENSIFRVVLKVVSDNYRAIKLYRRFGFVEEGRLIKDRYYPDKKEFSDSIIMARIKF